MRHTMTLPELLSFTITAILTGVYVIVTRLL